MREVPPVIKARIELLKRHDAHWIDPKMSSRYFDLIETCNWPPELREEPKDKKELEEFRKKETAYADAVLYGFSDREFYDDLCKALYWGWQRIEITNPDPAYHDLWQRRYALFQYEYVVLKLIRILRQLRPELPECLPDRDESLHEAIFGQGFGWSDIYPELCYDPFFQLYEKVRERFIRQQHIDKTGFKFNPPIPAREPEIEVIIEKFQAWRAALRQEVLDQKIQESAQNLATSQKSGWRVMPHNPDAVSMQGQYDWAIKHRESFEHESMKAKAEAGHDIEFFNNLATACFIEGYIGYLLNKPLHEVKNALCCGCDYTTTTLRLGFQAHAWSINDSLHEAIACGHHGLADVIMRLRPDTWDTDRIRPVNWLVTRIRLVMELYIGHETELKALLENERKAVFEQPLPEELEIHVPEMRNFYELLKALVANDNEAFNRALAARMPIREAHYKRGGTIAPIALIDVHGLALCRLARKRGLRPKIEHVYLPLQILDLGVA